TSSRRWPSATSGVSRSGSALLPSRGEQVWRMPGRRDRDLARRSMRGERSIYVALGLISFATLVLQVSLTRLFSFTLYYYFAYMVISTALLGLAAAGSVVAVAPGLREGDVPRRLARLAVAAGLSIIVSLGVIARTPLVPGRLAADRMQWIWIAVTYIAVLAPFFLSGLSVTV